MLKREAGGAVAGHTAQLHAQGQRSSSRRPLAARAGRGIRENDGAVSLDLCCMRPLASAHS
jgi:hypothetical protein